MLDLFIVCSIDHCLVNRHVISLSKKEWPFGLETIEL